MYTDMWLSCVQGVCTEAGMYALRERRVHVTQEDFELAVAKVRDTIFRYFPPLKSYKIFPNFQLHLLSAYKKNVT